MIGWSMMTRAVSVGSNIVVVSVSGVQPNLEWSVSGDTEISGTFEGRITEAFDHAVDNLSCSKQRMNHTGKLFAARNKDGRGLVLETKGSQLRDTGLTFGSQAEAQEYIDDYGKTSNRI